MTRLVFVDVDDTLLTPPYEAVRRVATFLGKKFPPEDAFLNRSHVDYHKAFPGLFRNSAEMWAIALISLPFGHFKSQAAMPIDVAKMAKLLGDHRVYLVSKNPPSFTRWRVQRLRQIFNVDLGDRYIACGPIFKKGDTKLAIIDRIAQARGVALSDCLLVDDSIENLAQVAAAGVRCAVVKSSWNEADIGPLKANCPTLMAITSADIPAVLTEYLASYEPCQARPHFLVPQLSVSTVWRMALVFLKRWWLYGEPLPALSQIVPIARNPLTSLVHTDPHAKICDRLEKIIASPASLACVRVLPLLGKARPMLLPVGFFEQLSALTPSQKIRALRTVARIQLQAHGHTFVRDARFYFSGLDRTVEKARILSCDRIARAKRSHCQAHGLSPEEAHALAMRHTDELLTSRSYITISVGEWILDAMLGKIFKNIHLKTHPMVRALEDDHFLFFAASHRSYLDSAVLWSLLSHSGQSSPYAVAADKMRSVWFGRLGSRAGTFFLRRTYVDDIYSAVMAEHVGSMQRPGSTLEVFLEGQRSRSGLTLPPKKGIASVVWGNMDENSKVAIVPVSFTYNKIPESEKLIKERFDERKKMGLASLRETSDMRIKRARRKTLGERLKSTWRRYKSQLISECYVHFAEPIILTKSANKADLQGYLDETMRRINSATAVLPSSMLCLYLLGLEDKHSSSADAVAFLHFCDSMMALYDMPAHLYPNKDARSSEEEVRIFAALPFINRKFKRARVPAQDVLCINELDLDRASFYRNNVLHFFALPGILSHVLVEVNHGHIEELHRCFDHMFDKLQKTYFLPQVPSARAFIDRFIGMLVERGVVVVQGQQWRMVEATELGSSAGAEPLLHVLSGLGADIIQGDLPHLLDSIRRSSRRKDVHVPLTLIARQTTHRLPAQASAVTQDTFLLTCEADCELDVHIEFTPLNSNEALCGVVTGLVAGGIIAKHHTGNIEELLAHIQADKAATHAGHVAFVEHCKGSGVMTNVSPNGAFITTDMDLHLGDTLTCTLGAGLESFVVQGKVTRVMASGVGLRFGPLSEENEARLALLSVTAATTPSQSHVGLLNLTDDAAVEHTSAAPPPPRPRQV